MVHFVVPFKSKQVSKNWKLDSRYCLRTIKSLLNQTSDAYTVTLACHQRPVGFERVASHPKIHLIERPDLWVPSDPEHTPSLMADRDRKLRAAMASLKKYNDGYAMIVDADDVINRKITDYVLSLKKSVDLFYADIGYIFDQSTNLLLRKKRMHRRVGSSLIFKFSRSDLPDRKDDKKRPKIITNKEGNVNHQNVVDSVRNSDNRSSEPIPFPAVCYIVGTGLNVVGGGYQKSTTALQKFVTFAKACTRFWQLRYPSRSWRKEFGLDISEGETC